jgi:hypothetical protein
VTATDAQSQTPNLGTVDLKLEVVTLPVSDVDRSKAVLSAPWLP